MNDNKNNYLIEAVKQKIKLFTKESYYSYFNYILTEKAKKCSSFKKKTVLSFSVEFLLKEKEKAKNSLKIKEIEIKGTPKSVWHLLMLLICNIPNKKKLEYRNNKFNLNPICYSYLKNLCHKKLKLLQSFSNNYKIPLDILVKFYLDLCTNQIKENDDNDNDNNNEMSNIKNDKVSRIIDYKRLLKKSNPQIMPKRQNIKKNNNNNNNNNNNSNNSDKKSPILGLHQVEFSNSITRLFIGEIDPISVKERYSSDIVVKKLKQLHLYNSSSELSNIYLKRLYNKLFKKEQKGYIDGDMLEIMNKFKYDSKKVENYKRACALSFEKKNMIDENYGDYIKKSNKKIKRKNFKLLSLSPIVIKNNNKINFKFEKQKHYNMRYRNNYNSSKNIFNNDKSQNISLHLSSNLSSYKIRSISVKPSRNSLKKQMSYKLLRSNSTFNINNNSGNNYNKYKNKDYLFIRDLKQKKDIIGRNNNILTKLQKRFDEKNSLINTKRRLNLKNFLKKDDFFFSNMN